jgi:phage shock protein PspC (stress-responsive transcriptional regulator)/predicted membrane protein
MWPAAEKDDDEAMTTDDFQAQQGSPPPRAYPPLHTLRRSRTDRKLFGVAGGLGHYAGVDPLIFRILFVVLAVFGGSGILLYALGWLLIPEEGQRESEGQRLFRGHTSGSTVSTVVAGLVVLILGLVFMGSVLDTGPGIGGLGALVIVGLIVALLLNRGQRSGPPQPPASPPYGPVPPPEPGTYGQTPGTAYVTPAPAEGPPPPPSWTAPTQPIPPPPPKPPRERSVLGRVTFSVALIVVGLMIAWNLQSDNDFKVVTILASALAVVGAGVIVGAFRGRAPWLIVLGIVLAFATSMAGIADHRWGAGIGERTWTPQTVAEADRPYRLGVGDATLDLTELPPGSDVDVQSRLGIGQLLVLVPLDAEVVVEADVGAGNLVVLDEPTQDGTDLNVHASDPAITSGSGTTITLDAAVGLGELEVRRAAP